MAHPEGLQEQSFTRLLDGCRQPLVIVFAAEWDRTDPETLEAIRAELRCLGAALLVVTAADAFCFRPDYDSDVLVPRELREPEALSALFQRCNVDRARLARGGLALALLDETGQIHFRTTHAGAPSARGTGTAAVMLERLVLARESVASGTRLLFSRREAVLLALTGALAISLAEACSPRRQPAPKVTEPPPASEHELDVVLSVNGKDRALRIEPRVSLLDALRERLALTGSKKGCDHGQCGACTVLLDGRRVNSCLVLAVMARGKSVLTIEGLAQGETLDPLQAAFVREDALQCGYCTPGQIMSAKGLLAEGRARTDDEVREHMSGNLCRCGAYPNIVKAIQSARGTGIPA